MKNSTYTPEDIINYLCDNMLPAARQVFDANLAADPKLARTVAAFKKELNRSILTTNIANTHQAMLRPTFWQRINEFSTLHKAGISVFFVAIIAIGTYFLYKNEAALVLPTVVSAQVIDSLTAFECPTDAIPQHLINSRNYPAAAEAAQLKIDSVKTTDISADITALSLIKGVCIVRNALLATQKNAQIAAITTLSEATKNENYTEEALFYSAIAHIRLNNAVAANTALNAILQNTNYIKYKKQAVFLKNAL